MAAVLLSLVPFVVIEFCLATFWTRAPQEISDPFVSFTQVIPLFEAKPDQQKFVISPEHKRFFASDEFSLEKSENTFRIFCLGGSTVQGRPYSVETSFTRWLKIALETSDPERNWEVVNCGGVSYASYRLTPILQECLKHQPDLIILCTGHNEFLEDRTYQPVKQVPGWAAYPAELMIRSNTVQFVASYLPERFHNRTVMPAEADPFLDYQNGLAAYQPAPDWYESVANHFELNLEQMVLLTKREHVPLLMLLPPSNLSGAPPFKSESPRLTGPEQKRLLKLSKLLSEQNQQNLSTLIDIAKERCRLAPESAQHWYELGQIRELSGDYEAARHSFIQARDLDICPLRMTSPLQSRLLGVADSTSTPLINLHDLLEQETPHQILGNTWLVDHVHPNFEGHQKIAIALAKWMSQERFIALKTGWESQCQTAFQTHFDSLPRTYFHRGQRQLKALRLWTQGKADGPPAEDRFPHRFSIE